MSDSSPRAIYVAVGANAAVAATKFAAGAVAGSSAILAEAVHSLIDACDGLLLLFGRRRAARPPDEKHPFGHGREAYFWSFVVALLFFSFGSALTVAQGVRQWLNPHSLGHPGWGYLVLGASAIFDATSFAVAYKQLRQDARGRSTWTVIHESKNPALFSIVLEDFADLVGLVIAFLGLALSHALNMPRIDAVAAIAIGVLLGAIAFVLLVETHGLLIGEAAGPRVLADVCSIATNVPGVVKATSPSSLHFGPDDVVVAMWVQFDHALDADEVAQRVALIEQRIRGEHPEVRHVYLQSGPLAETR